MMRHLASLLQLRATRLFRLALPVMVVLLASATMSAAQQTTGSGAIEGRVTDETDAALPGATVTATSPALQVPQVTEVTNANGDYRFVDLPAGLYRLEFQLAGFQTIVRADLRLNVGFVSRINVQLKVGGIEESITVSGQGPLVDLTTTAGSTNFTKETLEAMPTTRSVWQVLSMSPGIRMQGVDIAGSQLATQQTYKNYGTTGLNMPNIEGVNAQQAGAGIGGFFDYTTFEEVQVSAVGNDASAALPGTNLQVIVKSGGNDFHGTYAAGGATDELQSNNLDDALRAQNVTSGNALRYTYDVSGDLGGRIIRDKLWFYGAYRNQRRVTSLPGYAKAPGPDGQYGTADDVAGEGPLGQINKTTKWSFQPSSQYKVVGFYLHSIKDDPETEASRFRPYETTYYYHAPFVQWKGELQGSPTHNTLFSVLYGNAWYKTRRLPQPGTDRAGNPSRLDRNTGIYSGTGSLPSDRPRFRWQSQGWLSVFPQKSLGGRHSFKLGYQLYWELVGNTAYFDKASGNYLLIYDRVGGIKRPVEIDTYNSPIIDPQNRENVYSAYATDSWRIGNRLTANLGLRFDRYRVFVDEQTKVQGTFGTSGTFPKLEVASANVLAPRIGLAYDLGDSKTVLKGTYGRYNHSFLEDFAANFNPNTLITTTYRWSDQDGNNDYTPGEVNLDVNGGADFLRVAGASNNIMNTDLELPRTHEVSLGLERELSSVIAVKALYVYKRQNALYAGVNILRPYSAYNIPITRRDPGPDGLLNTGDDAGAVTFYDYDPAYRGGRFVGNQFQNRLDGSDDAFHTMEFTVNKRVSRSWDMLGSFAATKNHRWLASSLSTSSSSANLQTPNDEFFPLDETWDWQFKATSSYTFPRGFLASVFFQHLAGIPGQRTYIFRTVDPDGGRQLTQSGTITLRLEPFGDQRSPAQNVLNLRASKRFNLNSGRRFDLMADLFNALNVSAPTSVTYASGPSFGAISAILPPRVLRLGATFGF